MEAKGLKFKGFKFCIESVIKKLKKVKEKIEIFQNYK